MREIVSGGLGSKDELGGASQENRREEPRRERQRSHQQWSNRTVDEIICTRPREKNYQERVAELFEILLGEGEEPNIQFNLTSHLNRRDEAD